MWDITSFWYLFMSYNEVPMFRLKRFFHLFLMLVIIFIMSLFSKNVLANDDYSNDEILSLDKKELLETLKKDGLNLPSDFAEHKDLAENFVHKYTMLILEGKIDSSGVVFSYTQSNDLLNNLYKVLLKKKVKISDVNFSVRTSSKLMDSTLIGSWSNSYFSYNCYAYSIDRTKHWLLPGDLSKRFFKLTMSIYEMADVVLKDLESLGYWGYYTTKKPDKLPDKYFRVICIRKDLSNEDFHFMRTLGNSLNVWTHKPGSTQLLKWNYSTPSKKVWTNEAYSNGKYIQPTVTYESDVYYILYKDKRSQGIQLNDNRKYDIYYD